MKRIVAVAAALALLAFAGIAYAASTVTNSYSGSKLAFSAVKGTAKKPAPLAWKETLKAKPTSSTYKRAAVLTDILVKVYGMTENTSKAFPTCSAQKIDTAPKYGGNCPKKSFIGSGPVQAEIGSSNLTQPGFACNTVLQVYNGGGGKAWYFFTTNSPTACGGLTTGQTAPYEGTSKREGKYLAINVPLPSDVSTAVANHNGLYGSLESEVLTFPKLTVKSGKKTLSLFNSVGCTKNKRAWSIKVTSTSDGGKTHQTKTVTGKSAC